MSHGVCPPCEVNRQTKKGLKACALSPFYKNEKAFLTQFRIFEILFFKRRLHFTPLLLR